MAGDCGREKTKKAGPIMTLPKILVCPYSIGLTIIGY
jgi:hypothetical protein